MTEKEKMLKQQLYDANHDTDLKLERVKAKELCHQYNQLSTFSSALQPFLLYYGRSSQLLTPLFPHTPRLSVVKHVVKNRFLNTLVTGDRKRFFIVCRSAADGCFVAPVCRIVPLLERLSKSFMQGQAAQNLHRNRQRIPSRICLLEIKLTLRNSCHKIIFQPCCL